MFLFHTLYRAPPLTKSSPKFKKPDKTVPKIKHMLHSVEDFEKALAAVVEKYTSIGSAAKEFHIPHKTLSDWINGMIFQRTPIILKFFIPNPSHLLKSN